MDSTLSYIILSLIGFIIVFPIIRFLFTRFKKNWTVSERNFVSGLLTLTVLPLLGYVILFSIISYEQRVPQLEFDEVRWAKNMNDRHQMINDIIDEERLLGLNKESVSRLLGQPDSYSDKLLVYFAGSHPAGFGLKFYYLHINLKNDVVYSVESKQIVD